MNLKKGTALCDIRLARRKTALTWSRNLFSSVRSSFLFVKRALPHDNQDFNGKAQHAIDNKACEILSRDS